MPSPDIAIFLGAGASCSEGAPSQGELFRKYFELYRSRCARGETYAIDPELRTFFHRFFGIDVDRDDLATAQFPTFEEALGTLELAILRDESFRGFGNAGDFEQGSRVRSLRGALILLIAVILKETLEHANGSHRVLVNSLMESNILSSCVFLTFNYDILIDNALIKAQEVCDLDYAIEFTNFERQDTDTWYRPRIDRAVPLLKLHGSLNWLLCPTCRAITLTPKEKGACELVTDPKRCLCLKCETLSVPIIIPPTYFKVLSNLYLQEVWHQAERSLAASDIWIFCGYSFPDADIHVKYLLKRVEVNSPKRRKVVVFNGHDRKPPEEARSEKARFLRFLLPSSEVEYSDGSFQDFARDPMNAISQVTR